MQDTAGQATSATQALSLKDGIPLSALWRKFGAGSVGEAKTLLGKPAVPPRGCPRLKGGTECATVFRKLSTKESWSVFHGYIEAIGAGERS